ncbi:MAG: ArnT family glycosyltransferase [Prevotellamassilia sp.]
MMLQSSTLHRRYAWMLALICIISLFFFLGETLFNTRGEPREAVVAVSMLEHGNWVLPVNNGVDMAYKPPFFHWLIATFSLLTGGVTEYTARIPSALALAAMVLAGYGFYAKRRGAEVAFLMGLITLSNFEVHRAGVACRVDMVLTLMMVWALYQLYRWVERDMQGLPWWGILALSGAFLSKGPVGLGLPCLTVALFAWVRGKGFARIFGRFFVVGLLACILPAIWYVAAYQQGGQRFWDLVYEENVLRLLGKMSYASHINPWPYNVMTVITGFVPYTLLVLMSLFVLHYRKPSFGSLGDAWARFRTYIRTMDDARLFSLMSFVVIFVFYCIPKSKRSVYLLPVYPFLAYFLAEYILWLRDHHRRVLDWFGWVLASLAALLSLVFIVVRLGGIPESWMGVKDYNANPLMLRALRYVADLARMGSLFRPNRCDYFLHRRKEANESLSSCGDYVDFLHFLCP